MLCEQAKMGEYGILAEYLHNIFNICTHKKRIRRHILSHPWQSAYKSLFHLEIFFFCNNAMGNITATAIENLKKAGN